MAIGLHHKYWPIILDTHRHHIFTLATYFNNSRDHAMVFCTQYKHDNLFFPLPEAIIFRVSSYFNFLCSPQICTQDGLHIVDIIHLTLPNTRILNANINATNIVNHLSLYRVSKQPTFYRVCVYVIECST